MSIGHAWDLSSDAELITAVRSGEGAAFGVLYERHAGAARTVARQYSNSEADAEDAVAEAFSRVFSAIQGGGGPDVAFRAYLFTVLRRVAMERVESGRRAQPTDDVGTFEAAFGSAESTEEPAMAGFERGIVSQAYSSLPERWQAVLWYTEVEGLSAAEIAPVLGLTANGVAALAYRAREGLRQAYLQQHLAAPTSEACTLVNSKLGSYVRGGLAKRETALVESHLEECGACRALVLELGDVNHGMRVVIAPLVLGAVAVGLIKGIGFGGAIAAAGHGAAVGAGLGGAASGWAGGGAASGSGGVAAGSQGGGVTVGAGSGAAAGAGSGAASGALVGAGVGAAGVAAVAAGAAVLGRAEPAAAATGAAATTTGAAGAGAGGFLGLLAAAPVAVGVAAAVVVAGVAVGIAGMLGVFSADQGANEAGAGPSATEGATDGGASTDGSGTDGPADGGEQGADAGADGSTGDDATGDGSNPGGVTAGGSTVVGAGGTGASTPAPSPTAEPTPGPTVEPARLTLGSLPALDLVAGVATPLEITVTNTGGTDAAEVRTELVFDAGVDWQVTAVAEPPTGGPGAAVPQARANGWSCAPSSPTTAVCSTTGLAKGASTTLRASVLVNDDTPDLAREIQVGISTWVPGQGARPAPTILRVSLASAPARIVATGVGGSIDLVGADTAAVAEVLVPVRNEGSTTARNVHVAVDLPSDLPAGLTVSSSASDGWLCAPAGGALDCSVVSITPGASAPLALQVTAPALDLTSAAPFVDIDVSTALSVRAGTTDVVVPVSVRSAPGRLEVALSGTTTLQQRQVRVLAAAVRNTGGSRLTGLQATVDLPPGVVAANLVVPSDWTCDVPGGDGPVVTCALDALGAGGTAELGVPVRTDVAGTTGDITASVSAGAVAGSARSAVEVVTSIVAFSSPAAADLVADASGTIAFAVSNTGQVAARDLTARVLLPHAVSFDAFTDGPVGDGGWSCTRSTDQLALCSLPVLEAGSTASLVLPATPTASSVELVVVQVTAGAEADAPVLTSTAPLRIASAGLSPRGHWAADGTVGYTATQVGAPLLSCRWSEAGCLAARADLGGSAANNGFTMVPLTDAKGVPVDSTSTLAVPQGSTVVFAGLYWSANHGPTDAWSGPLTRIGLRAPGSEAFTTVTGEVVAQHTDNARRAYYQSFADVTDLVAAGGSGSWAATGAAVTASLGDKDRSYYAGWALVVVYSTPGVDKDVTVYDGGAWVGSGSSTTFAFEASDGRSGDIGVVAWEGDRGNTGDQLTLNGAALTPRRWDGTLASGTSDAFTSTAMGSAYANSLGVDVKPFASAVLRDGINRLTASTAGDQYMIGAVTVTSTPR